MQKLERAEFRRAIADEVSTLRALNTALRGPITPADSAALLEVRQLSMSTLMSLFTTLYPRRKPMGAAKGAK